MSPTPSESKANSEEIIRSMRRRARASSSRSRNSADPATGGPLADTGSIAEGNLAVDVDFDEVAAPEPGMPTRQANPKRQSQRQTQRRGVPAVLPLPDVASLPRPAFISGVVGLMLAGILGLLFLNVTINQDSYHLQELTTQTQQMQQTQQQLTDDLSQLNSPNNLEAQADRMGLVKPDTISYLDLKTGEKTTTSTTD